MNMQTNLSNNSINNQSATAIIVKGESKVSLSVYYCVRIMVVSTVSILIIISNLLNLYILSGKCHVPKISKIFLLNLSFSDLCVGLVSCLPTIYTAVTDYWPYGPVWCQISGIVHGTSCAISILSIALVSLDRYLAICKPMTYTRWRSPRKAHIVILSLWIFSFGSFVTPTLTKPDFIYYQFDTDENMCGIFWEYKWFCIMQTFYYPILSGCILVFTNIQIVKTVVTRKKCLNNVNCRSSVPQQLSTSSSGKERRQTTVVYVINFLFCLGAVRNRGSVIQFY